MRNAAPVRGLTSGRIRISALILALVILVMAVPALAAVTGSSGSDEFDTAALNWIETATYLPAERAGAAVGSTANLAVDFVLRT